MSHVTINDVARETGVSKRTVTRVINDEPGSKAYLDNKGLALDTQGCRLRSAGELGEELPALPRDVGPW